MTMLERITTCDSPCLPLKKTEYRRIAAQMRPEEVHPEVREKLDTIAAHFEIEPIRRLTAMNHPPDGWSICPSLRR